MDTIFVRMFVSDMTNTRVLALDVTLEAPKDFVVYPCLQRSAVRQNKHPTNPLFCVHTASPSAFPLSTCSLCLRLSSPCEHSATTQRDVVLFNAGENMMRVCFGCKVSQNFFGCSPGWLASMFIITIQNATKFHIPGLLLTRTIRWI